MNSSSDEQNQKQQEQQFISDVKKSSKEVNKSKEKKRGKGKGEGKKPKEKEKKEKKELKQPKEPKKKTQTSKNKGANIQRDAQTVKQYLQKQNRPYNVLNIFDNLHGSIKKTSLQAILDSLAETGFLSCKQFGKNKVYFLNQIKFQINEGEIQKITEELTLAREQSSQLQAKHKELLDDYRKLIGMKTENEIIEEIKKLKEQKVKLQARKQKLMNAGDNKMNEDVVIQAEKQQEKIRRDLKKLKTLKKDALASWCEILEKKPLEVAEIMGIDL